MPRHSRLPYRRFPFVLATAVIAWVVAAAACQIGPGPEQPGQSSDQASASHTQGRPLAGRSVLLDPGHNPHNASHPKQINQPVDIGNGYKACDTTGTSTEDGYPEASFTLDTARRTAALLQRLGARIIFTQNGDLPWGPCINERAAKGNRDHADAAVSIHADGASETDQGFHVILPAPVVAGRADNRSIIAPSRRLGLLLKSKYAAATGQAVATYAGDGSGIDVRNDLGGLNLSHVPKVFIECGNMRNPDDARHITSPSWRQRAARGLADAIAAFLSSR
jgi:N-acetylmuramoyl-L-alanine amidase